MGVEFCGMPRWLRVRSRAVKGRQRRPATLTSPAFIYEHLVQNVKENCCPRNRNPLWREAPTVGLFCLAAASAPLIGRLARVEFRVEETALAIGLHDGLKVRLIS
jgi:hypothetical protein